MLILHRVMTNATNKTMKDYFYFTKSQRRGVILFIACIAVAAAIKWIL